MIPQNWMVEWLKMHMISNEVIKETMKNSTVKLTVRGKICCDENPERYLPGRYAVTITICNSDEAT